MAQPRRDTPVPASVPASSAAHFGLCPSAEAAAFAHVTQLPPHGPFAYLSAATLSRELRHGNQSDPSRATAPRAVSPTAEAAEPVDVSPQRCLEFFASEWNLEHMRQWPTFYAESELRVENVKAVTQPG